MSFIFDNAKEDYLKQLKSWSDSIRFTAVGTKNKKIKKSEDLDRLFIMPDVVEGNIHSRSADRSPISALELLNQEPSSRIVLLGDSSSGKTILLATLANLLAKSKTADRNLLPIFIDIRHLSRLSNIDLLASASQFAEQVLLTASLPVGFFGHWLKEGRAVILLDGWDGIDEIADPCRRYEIRREVERFLAHYRRKSLAIIASRPAGYNHEFFSSEDFKVYNLQPFDDPKVNKFIDVWCDLHMQESENLKLLYKERFKKALDKDARSKMLTRNPLLLTIAISSYAIQGYLPDTRYDFYKKTVAFSFDRSDLDKKMIVHQLFLYLSADDIDRLIESVAYWIHVPNSKNISQQATVIAKSDLIYYVTQEIKKNKPMGRSEAAEEAERFVNFLTQRTYFFSNRGQGFYAFENKTFQEYLCAREISYRADDEYDFYVVLNYFRECLHDSHWREVLLFLICQTKPKRVAKILRTILDNNDVLFAGACLAESRGLKEVDVSLVEEILEKLIDLEVEDESVVGVRVRSQVFQILCSMKGTVFRDRTLQLLRIKCVDQKQLSSYEMALT